MTSYINKIKEYLTDVMVNIFSPRCGHKNTHFFGMSQKLVCIDCWKDASGDCELHPDTTTDGRKWICENCA